MILDRLGYKLIHINERWTGPWTCRLLGHRWGEEGETHSYDFGQEDYQWCSRCPAIRSSEIRAQRPFDEV